MQNSGHNILSIANSDQCCYCGVCLGVCPGLEDKKNLFVQKYDICGWQLDIQQEEKCGSCTLCRDVCPMNRIDYRLIETQVFPERKTLAQHPLVGYYRNAYVGHSTNENLRLQGASGGVITTLLFWLFEREEIDGALIVVPGSNGPLDYQGIIVDCKEQLSLGAGSHYLPIPAMAAIDKLLYGPYRKVALVGIPCQLTGVRKAQERLKKLSQRVAIQLGSFCGYTSHFQTVAYLQSRLPESKQPHVRQILYRKGKWPGNIKVVFNDNREDLLQGEMRDHIAFTGILPACLYCADHFNEFADISFGDAWLEEYLKRRDGGYSVIIVRTERGQNVIDEAVNAGRLRLFHHPIEDVVKSQRGPMHYKKQGLGARLFLKRWFTAQTPSILNARLMPWGSMDLVAAIALLIQIRVSKSLKFWSFLYKCNTGTVQKLFKPMHILQKRYDLWPRSKKKLHQIYRRIFHLGLTQK